MSETADDLDQERISKILGSTMRPIGLGGPLAEYQKMKAPKPTPLEPRHGIEDDRFADPAEADKAFKAFRELQAKRDAAPPEPKPALAILEDLNKFLIRDQDAWDKIALCVPAWHKTSCNDNGTAAYAARQQLRKVVFELARLHARVAELEAVCPMIPKRHEMPKS